MSCMTLAAIGLHLFSLHSGQQFNDDTLGGFARADCEVLGGQPQVGAFKNSENNTSIYAALEYELDRDAILTPFGVVGAATGYESYPVVPLINGGVRLLIGPVGFALGYSPPFGDYGAHMMHFAMDVRF